MWLLPALLLVAAIVCSIPLSGYFAWLMDGKYRAPRVLKWFEDLVDTGPQDWKQYAFALVVFNIALFVFGFVVLCLQPIAPLNPRGLSILAPSTIFNTVISFMTNTNLQHYSGDQHLSNFSQIFFILPNMFLSASVGFCALAAIIRAFRGEATVGNFFVDMWRVAMYIYVPVALVFGVIFMQQGMPMTYASTEVATTLESGSMGLDDKIGSLKPGKRADLIAINTNALNMAVVTDPAHLVLEATGPENVDTVVVDGRILKRGGKLVALDTRKVIAEARAALAGVRERTKWR